MQEAMERILSNSSRRELLVVTCGDGSGDGTGSESSFSSPAKLSSATMLALSSPETASSGGEFGQPRNRRRGTKHRRKLTALFRPLLQWFPLYWPTITPSCGDWLASPPTNGSGLSPIVLGSRVTGTLFGYRKGHIHLAIQECPAALPALLFELAMPTNSLVKEMASGLVRIALECERTYASIHHLYQEPVWSMYCNGRKTGYALRRSGCSEMDLGMLRLVRAVSMGAGVLPMEGPEGELMYMRAKFERVVGSRDSEAFYMINPDGTGIGPELSIFLLRI